MSVCTRHLLCGVDGHAVDLVHLGHSPLMFVCKQLHQLFGREVGGGGVGKMEVRRHLV